ncbi:hypothetical protein AZKH_p0402 (plasmid) [Azoarcus sp. KH32C]|nr:hypothetical protein AZKH_p0402 [Azoarcus sp. KH32C]
MLPYDHGSEQPNAKDQQLLVLALPRGGVPVGFYYTDFTQTTRDEVIQLLQQR